jgi:RNA polymerase sigma-70 factor (ECF subfamily)
MDVETTRSREDFRLIERYLAGDEYAVDEIVTKYQRKVYSLAYRMTGDIEDAKDMTQKVFLQAFKGIRDFRRKSAFYTWLYQIAYNTCLNHLRKKGTDTVEIHESHLANNEGSLSKIIMKEKKSHLKDALKYLPLRQKTAITLRAYEGLSLKETAEVMQCSEGAVKAHYHHGMKKLRGIFKERGYEIKS